MRRNRQALGSFILVAAVGCAAVQIPRATEIDRLRAATHRPSTTLADLERGRALYLSRCAGCHQPISPRSVRAEDWPGHVAEMKKRARLQTAEVDLVVLYLVTMATAINEQGNADPLRQSVERR